VIGKNKESKALIRFHSANKIGKYNRGGKKKTTINLRKLQNKSKHRNNKSFLESLLLGSFPSLGGHRSPHPPRMPSSTVLLSGPAVGAAQARIWSYSCVFLPILLALWNLIKALLSLFFPITFLIAIINLTLSVGLLQFCGVFLFFLFSLFI